MKKAISATLAGALAVGMVPAMALAAEPDQELELQVSAAEEFSKGKITQANWNDGNPVSLGDPAHTNEVSAAKDYIIPVKVTPNNGSAIDITAAAVKANYKVSYVKAGADGKPTAEEVAAPTTIGSYFVKVEAVAGQFAGGVMYLAFSITGDSLAAAADYEIYPLNPGKIDDETLNYTGEAQKIGFKIGTTKLIEGTDYTVKYYKSDDDPKVVAGSSVAPTVKGSYYAILTGMGKYAGQVKHVSFDIAACAVTAADIVIDDVIGDVALPTAVTSVKKTAAMNGEFKLGNYTAPATGMGTYGQYTVQVSLTEAAAKAGNISMAAYENVTFYKVKDAAVFKYGDAALPSTYTYDASVVGAAKFDVDAIKAYKTDGTSVVASVVSITKNGETATKNDLEKGVAGVYEVLVDIANPADASNGCAVGGKAVITVTNTQGAVDGKTDITFKYAGQPVDSVSVVYDPTKTYNVGSFDFVAKKGTTSLNKADFTEQLYNAKGEKVTSIQDAGTYTLVLESTKYSVTNNVLQITIAPKAVTGLAFTTPAQLQTVNGKPALVWPLGTKSLPLNSVDVAPWIDSATGDNANGKYNSGEEFAVTDIATAKLVYTLDGKAVTAFTQPGVYKIELVVADKDMAPNYVLPEPIELTVAEKTTFIDVPTSHWAYKNIESAYAKGYVNGKKSGTQLTGLFGPSELLTRGQVVCIAYNIMGGAAADADSAVGALYDVESMYSDVKNSAYYAEALAWATNRGVVSGDKGKDTFRPNDPISVQETVAIYANVAKALGWDMSYTADAFDGIKDAESVSNWAKPVMAWAAENGYVGQGGTLNAKGTIARDRAVVIADRIFAVDPFVPAP